MPATPRAKGSLKRDGQRLFYEVYGEGEETVFLIPTWSLLHSRHWKMQIPYFARHFRVLTMDGWATGAPIAVVTRSATEPLSSPGIVWR